MLPFTPHAVTWYHVGSGQSNRILHRTVIAAVRERRKFLSELQCGQTSLDATDRTRFRVILNEVKDLSTRLSTGS